MSIKAKYNDGERAYTYEVDFTTSNLSLIGKIKEGPLITLAFNDIVVLQAPMKDRDAIISDKNNKHQRFYFSNSEFKKIEKYLNKNQRNNFSHSVALYLIFVSILISGIFFDFFNFSRFLANYLPLALEKQLGNDSLENFLKENKVCNNQNSYKALYKILKKLDSEDYKNIKITVVENNNINAFATFDNNIIIYSNLIKQSSNPEMLASVIAHEIAHLKLRHPAELLVRNMGIWLFINTAFYNYDMKNIIALPLNLLELNYTRKNESEADDLALDMLQKANINIIAFKDFLSSLEIKEKDYISSFLSTHPTHKERIKNIDKRKLNYKLEPILSSREWKELKTICKYKTN